MIGFQPSSHANDAEKQETQPVNRDDDRQEGHSTVFDAAKLIPFSRGEAVERRIARNEPFRREVSLCSTKDTLQAGFILFVQRQVGGNVSGMVVEVQTGPDSDHGEHAVCIMMVMVIMMLSRSHLTDSDLVIISPPDMVVVLLWRSWLGGHLWLAAILCGNQLGTIFVVTSVESRLLVIRKINFQHVLRQRVTRAKRRNSLEFLLKSPVSDKEHRDGDENGMSQHEKREQDGLLEGV